MDVYSEYMETFEEFQPTQFDRKGAGTSDYNREWLVVPVGQTRDSGYREESNFETALKILETVDPAGNDHEVHRFSHWGPGWFEIIVVRPDSDCHAEAEGIKCALADYPILNDEDCSERENEAMQEAWDYMGLQDRIELCDSAGESIFAARNDYPPPDNDGSVQERLLGY